MTVKAVAMWGVVLGLLSFGMAWAYVWFLVRTMDYQREMRHEYMASLQAVVAMTQAMIVAVTDGQFTDDGKEKSKDESKDE